MAFGVFNTFRPLQPFEGPVGGVNALAALIKALFGADEQGGLWLPGPETCWTDIHRTTPAGVGDTVAFMDDLKDGVKLGPTLYDNPELVYADQTAAEVDWEFGDNWSYDSTTGKMINSGTNSNLHMREGLLSDPIMKGDWVEVVLVGASDPISVNIGLNSDVTIQADFVISDGVTHRLMLQATQDPTTSRGGFSIRRVSGTPAFSSIQLRKLPGNHATQSTADARPALARTVEGGRRNLLLGTDSLATQSVTVTAVEHILSFYGTGTVTLSGASTAGPLVGTGADDRVSLTFTPSAASLTLTVSGSVNFAQLEVV